jgi:hypothetical protein
MYKFTIVANNFLLKDIQAFYRSEYVGHRNPGNPNYINTLKNTYGNLSTTELNSAVQELENALREDLPQIFQLLQLNTLICKKSPRCSHFTIQRVEWEHYDNS